MNSVSVSLSYSKKEKNNLQGQIASHDYEMRLTEFPGDVNIWTDIQLFAKPQFYE